MRFRTWAPTTRDVDVIVDSAGGARVRRLTREADGMHSGRLADVAAGDRYRYRLDGDGPFPDPASRWQPDGVHGASMIVDSGAFAWSDTAWAGVPLRELVLYELHVGTFSPSGTFAGVTERLPWLQQLGVTGVELMPVADFPGTRNWGYDGTALFAPARCYGRPDDLRRLVDAAHALGLAVLLDVVYNHTGPDGSYLGRFSPFYFTDRYASPWGQGLDVDGEHSAPVREFFIENALHWVHEYHMDGLRLDATHAIQDTSGTHILAEMTDHVHRSVATRHVHVIAEDHRNLAMMVAPPLDFGWGLDAVWADDFHHQMRRLLAGDRDGYYRDFTGTTDDLAATLRQGWFFTGQFSEHLQGARGTDPHAVPLERFVVCLQNHDQIGNRARGERLHHQIDLAAFRAASAVLLTAPETPLLFMGQEWASTSPFQYFTDHAEPLGHLVSEGRRNEFRDFADFADPSGAERIPDPQRRSTFLDSCLRWPEAETEPHASMARFYQALLGLRRAELCTDDGAGAFGVAALDDATLLLSRVGRRGVRYLVVARLRGGGTIDLATHELAMSVGGWTPVLTSEDPEFTSAPAPLEVLSTDSAPRIRFTGPAAVIFRASQPRAASWAHTGSEALGTPPPQRSSA